VPGGAVRLTKDAQSGVCGVFFLVVISELLDTLVAIA